MYKAPINRTLISPWENPKVMNIVKEISRKQLILSGLWIEGFYIHSRSFCINQLEK